MQLICRAMRTCLLNAHVALKKAYEGSKDGAMEKAENDLKVRRFIPRSAKSRSVVRRAEL